MSVPENQYFTIKSLIAAPEMNISLVPDTVTGSQHFVLVTRNLCQSSVYDILLKFENLPVIVTGDYFRHCDRVPET